ncbi:MAG: PEP/pyruvate-binding domain-containing protein, partial [Gammaproteobacteria bacterium]
MSVLIPLSNASAARPHVVGLKAATLARLRRAGLRVPDAVCVTAEAYRARVTAGGLDDAAAGVAGAELFEGRKLALRVRLGMLRGAIDPPLADAIAAEYTRLAAPGDLVAVRSSALCEDTADASFAGQFDTFLGIANETDLFTAIHACWASLWSSRALRYMRAHEIDPAHTAMAVLIQQMIAADAAGGALSQAPDDELVITGTWGLGSVIAQGEVVPDRFVLRRDGTFERVEPGRKDRLVSASAGEGPRTSAVPR